MLVFEFLQLNPGVFLLFCTLLGLSLGSFLNVVAYRLPLMMERDWRQQCKELLQPDTDGPAPPVVETFNLSRPRSRCPECGH